MMISKLTPRERIRLRDEARVRAERHYDPRRPYHNWQHACTAEADGAALVERRRQQGKPADPLVVSAALFFHDAGYHLPHVARGYLTKEAFATDLMRRAMAAAGAPTQLIDAVGEGIAATHRDARCTTDEQRIVRLADIAGLAKPYETFLRNNACLKLEAEYDGNAPLSWQAWKQMTQCVVAFYLSPTSLHMLFIDHAERDAFSTAAHRNLARFLAEDEAVFKTIVHRVIADIGHLQP